jgi:aspartate/glutamate racemase
MEKIGLVGGLSPESTAHYYEIICREYNRKCGGLNFPEMTIESLNLQTLVERFNVNDWGGVATILLRVIKPESRAISRSLLENLVSNGTEAIVLGCTELSLLIKPEDSPSPLYDTTDLHAKAILSFALNDHPDNTSDSK